MGERETRRYESKRGSERERKRRVERDRSMEKGHTHCGRGKVEKEEEEEEEEILLGGVLAMWSCLKRRSLFGGFNFENYRDYDRRRTILEGTSSIPPRGDWRKFARVDERSNMRVGGWESREKDWRGGSFFLRLPLNLVSSLCCEWWLDHMVVVYWNFIFFG